MLSGEREDKWVEIALELGLEKVSIIKPMWDLCLSWVSGLVIIVKI